MRCLKIQAIGPICKTSSCDGFSMAKYFCSVCRFFDDERYGFILLKLSLLNAVHFHINTYFQKVHIFPIRQWIFKVQTIFYNTNADANGL